MIGRAPRFEIHIQRIDEIVSEFETDVAGNTEDLAIILGPSYEQSFDGPVAMGKRDTTKIISKPEIVSNWSGSLLSGGISNLPRKSGKSPFCAIAIRLLLGNPAQMPDLIEGHGAAAAKTVVEHEIQVYPPNGTGRETGRELVRRELCLAGHIGHGLAAAVVILARMAGVRRVVP
nr:hypothetical protein [Paracoccus versutus]